MSDELSHGVEADVLGALDPEPPAASERPATQLSVLPTPIPQATGVPAVDQALARLVDLVDFESDPEQHVAVLEEVHDGLQAALTGPDSTTS